VSAGPDDKTIPRDREPFVERWSRRKSEARSEAESRKSEGAAPTPAAGDQALPALPPVEKLDFDSDYRAFFHPKVSEDTRRAALKKLFSDSRFNVMDGLDVYIDDYSKSDPIPPAMLAGLRQAQKILEWAKGEDAESKEAGAEKQAAPAGPATLDEKSRSVPAPTSAGPISEDRIAAAGDLPQGGQNG
jgi:hypothetical protein